MSELEPIEPNEMPFQELNDMYLTVENAEIIAEETLSESAITGEKGQNPDFILNQVARALKHGKIGAKKIELEAEKEVKITRMVSMGEVLKHMLFTDPSAIEEILQAINRPAVIAALKGTISENKLKIKKEQEKKEE